MPQLIKPAKLPQPPRATLPITPGREPQWDLSGVDTNYLVAELIRRKHPKFFQPCQIPSKGVVPKPVARK